MTHKLTYVILLLALLASCALFMSYHTYGNWAFAFALRGKKMLAFGLVGIACSFSTLSFQTLTQNKLLTPHILGMDSLYVFMQTLAIFGLGSQTLSTTTTISGFLISIGMMMSVSTCLTFALLKKFKSNLFLFLMIGMILGTFFDQVSRFLQIILDPNEYDKLQGKLFASFSNVKVDHLLLAAVLIAGLCIILWQLAPQLDVLHLGHDQAINLGIDLRQLQLLTLVAITALVGISTALVGPTSFLGFIVATIAYQVMTTYRHRQLFVAASLIAMLFLILGDFLVTHLFTFNTTLNVIIEFTGGCYFIGRLLYERNGHR
ncbi:MAG: iron chelate uptake ABC transporter family permease subunit [Streptococcaceae bacterium]|jgi:iron complex transport system permease protein|nr:iron chelate uptake ABC transporter family permease subunit [Streptococcaceae bacterium]